MVGELEKLRENEGSSEIFKKMFFGKFLFFELFRPVFNREFEILKYQKLDFRISRQKLILAALELQKSWKFQKS